MATSCSSSVYGPVHSWRLGNSLGIDLLCVDSICSFDCVYCQLGRIRRLTEDRGLFVTTDKLIEDIRAAKWREADVVTFSGSGEPTLALNLGEAISEVKRITGKEIVVLTNSSLLNDPGVRGDLSGADRIFCKLDAWNSDLLRRINRPIANLTVERLAEGIGKLRAEFRGFMALQTMILSTPSMTGINRFARLIAAIRPDEIQLNVPSRPVPAGWRPEHRGNATSIDAGTRSLVTLTAASLRSLAETLEKLTDVRVVYPPSNRMGRPGQVLGLGLT